MRDQRAPHAVTLLLDTRTGVLLAEATDGPPGPVTGLLTEYLGSAVELGCARPLEVLTLPPLEEAGAAETVRIRVSGYYHNSLVEGPGRRTSVLLTGCTLGCKGCWVPDLHPAGNGVLVSPTNLAAVLLDPAFERDGVSILGGEPVRRIVGA